VLQDQVSNLKGAMESAVGQKIKYEGVFKQLMEYD
jgi:hypothetical protein